MVRVIIDEWGEPVHLCPHGVAYRNRCAQCEAEFKEWKAKEAREAAEKRKADPKPRGRPNKGKPYMATGKRAWWRGEAPCH